MEESRNIPVTPTSWSQLRDEALTEELQDFMAHDWRTAHLKLSIRVDRGVGRVEGSADSEEERQHVRRLLRRQGGLYAVWDLLALADQQLNTADIGCGECKQIPRSCGIDRQSYPGVDVVTDLEASLPIDDDTFDHIFAIHVLEHIRDLISLMNELHRVLRPGGVLHVLTPYWHHINAIADPTHVRFMDIQSFKYFCQPHPDVLTWEALMVTASPDTVFADLQPLKNGSTPSRSRIARWFY
jgi:SAM-dependent methyltransferase